MDTSSGCVSSERDFFGGLEDDDDPEELAGGPPDSDDIVLTVLCLTLVIDSNAHNVSRYLSTFTLIDSEIRRCTVTGRSQAALINYRFLFCLRHQLS